MKEDFFFLNKEEEEGGSGGGGGREEEDTESGVCACLGWQAYTDKVSPPTGNQICFSSSACVTSTLQLVSRALIWP